MAESLLDGIEEEKEGSYVTSDYKSLLPESGREKATSIRASAVNEVKLMGDCKTFFTFFKSKSNLISRLPRNWATSLG